MMVLGRGVSLDDARRAMHDAWRSFPDFSWGWSIVHDHATDADFMKLESDERLYLQKGQRKAIARIRKWLEVRLTPRR